MAMALGLLGDGANDAAADLLQQVPAQNRGWEWRHLWSRATEPPAVTTHAFTNPGSSSAAGLDGKSFAIGLPTGEVVLYRETAPPITLANDGSWVTHLYATPTGYIALYHDGEIRDISFDGQMLHTGRVEGTRPHVIWPTNDTYTQVAVGDGRASAVSILDLEQNEVIARQPATGMIPAVSTPGWTLLSRTGPDGDGDLVVEIVEGTFETRRKVQLSDREFPLSFDLDTESGIAIIGTTHGRALIYDLADDGEPRVYQSGGDGITALTMDPREDRAFLATDEQLVVFEISTGHTLLELPLEVKGLVRDIRWAPQTGTLAVVSDFGYTTWRATPQNAQLALR